MCEHHQQSEHEEVGHTHDGRSERLRAASRAIRAEGGGDAAGTFRVVVTGKGGVGKTSLVALLSRLLARQSYRVLALDADPQMNLPWALGMPPAEAGRIVPLSQNVDYVEEKTGARPGEGWGIFFRLNPNVEDVVQRFGVVAPDGVRLLVMGTTVQPAAGCLCPENSLLQAVVESLSLREGEMIMMDTQAGVEHFGRALAKGFHQAVVLSDPTFNGLQVALHAARLAKSLGIPAIHLVLNRLRSQAEIDRTLARLDGELDFPFTSRHLLPWEERLLECEPDVGALLDGDSELLRVATRLGNRLVRTEAALQHRETVEVVR